MTGQRITALSFLRGSGGLGVSVMTELSVSGDDGRCSTPSPPCMMPVSSSLRSQGAGELYPEDIESQTLNVYGILYAVMRVNGCWNVYVYNAVRFGVKE